MATCAEWESVVALSKDGGVVDGAVYFSLGQMLLRMVMMSPRLNCRYR